MSRLWIPEHEENKYTYPLIQRAEQLKVQLQRNTERFSFHTDKVVNLTKFLDSIYKRYDYLRGDSVKLVNFDILGVLSGNKLGAESALKKEKNQVFHYSHMIKQCNKEINRLNNEIQKNKTKILRFPNVN